MNNRQNESIQSFTVADAAEACVAAHLAKVFADSSSMLGSLNSWTQRLITNENMAKLALVFEAEEPAEACYRDLIREIDTEAESGIFLARKGSPNGHLDRVTEERGVSGQLYQDIDVVAPVVFADEVAHSGEDLDLVWVTIEACYARASLDATVSEIIMSHLLDNAEAVRDMSSTLRAVHYAFHEDIVRERCSLPRVIDGHDRREVDDMVSELLARSGSYEARIEAISQRAEASLRYPLRVGRSEAGTVRPPH
jgi:hypothetical protein